MNTESDEREARLREIRERRAKEYGHSFTGTRGTDAMMSDIDFLLSLLDSQAAIAQCAQAVLTALNVGDIQSGSPLHLKLREVMIAYRERALTDGYIDAFIREHENDPVDEAQLERIRQRFNDKLTTSPPNLASRASVAAVEGDAHRRSYSKLIHIAAEIVRGDGFLSTCSEDLAPRLRRADVLKTAERQDDRLKDWAYRIRQVADELPAAVSSPAPAEVSAAKFVPPAEDALHIAICQAVQEHHGPSANAILRTALNDYKPTQLTRTELIRVQQRSGSGEATAVMVSLAEPLQPTGEQEKI